jgi:peptide/nickel transport system permease protein
VSLGTGGVRRRPRAKLAVGAALVAVLVSAALLAPVLSPCDPLQQDLAGDLAPPSSEHRLGQDKLGRDVLARLLYGARTSLAVGIAAVSGAVALGVLFGALAGYGSPAVDELIMRVTDVLLAFPGILLAIALTAVLGPSERNVVFALTIMGWPSYARLTRAEVRAAASREYVAAAVALGANPLRVTVRHLIPAAWPPLLIQATFGMAGAILAEASLSFLGLGAPPSTPSWGAMLAEGRAFLLLAPHLIVAPGVAIATTVLAINLIGEGLRGDAP